MMKSIVGGLVCVALSTRASAEPTTANTTKSPTDNKVVMQLGLLPVLTLVGIEYARVLTTHVDLAASASIGLTSQFALVPHVQWTSERWTMGLGLGISVARVLDGTFFGFPVKGGQMHGGMLGELSARYETKHHLLFELRLGATGHCDGEESLFDCSESVVIPFGSIGVGFAL